MVHVEAAERERTSRRPADGGTAHLADQLACAFEPRLSPLERIHGVLVEVGPRHIHLKNGPCGSSFHGFRARTS